MKLREAIEFLNEVDREAAPYFVNLITAATPEPFATFLSAHLQRRLPDHRVVIKTGVFGDLAGNLERYLQDGNRIGILLMEWADLDPRLGLRHTGGWGRNLSDDIAATVQSALGRLLLLLGKLTNAGSLLIVPPTVAPAPVMPVPSWRMTALEARCRELLSHFLLEAYRCGAVTVLSPDLLETLTQDRLDAKALWRAGAPYSLAFASELGAQIATALLPQTRQKGIITDLDDTLWAGLLGEAGVGGVHWDLEHHAVGHGLYQQLLQSLAEEGVLVAVASKNDKSLVEECLQRPDLLVKPDSIFPVEAHWQPKADSVARILQIWNIGPESVVFIDDNAWEIEAMQMAYPQMDCRRFPANDPAKLPSFFRDLVDLFGQAESREEDKLRTRSIRAGAERAQLLTSGMVTEEEVLRVGAGELTIASLTVPPDPRALELVNKTNQFNLNGSRYSDGEWLGLLENKNSIATVASYRDKFGPLGKIAVLAGERNGRTLVVHTWVLSCRAFSRRIEHTMLSHLFEAEDLDEILLKFRRTERNAPVKEFFEKLTGEPVGGDVSLRRTFFDNNKPALYLSVATGA